MKTWAMEVGMEPAFKMRLEFVGANPANKGGRSSKFWECAVFRCSTDGANLVRRWGRIGSHPDSTVKHYPTTAAASTEAMKLMKQKQKKGYTLEVEPDIISLLAALEG